MVLLYFVNPLLSMEMHFLAHEREFLCYVGAVLQQH